MLNRVYVLLATLLSLSGSFLMVALQQLMMAFAGIIVLPALVLSAQQPPTDLERLHVRSLYDLARQARKEGKSSLVVPVPVETPLISDGLSDFIDGTVVAVATIRSSKSVPSGSYDDALTTWYTVSITEAVAGDRPLVLPPAGAIPDGLPALGPGELLVAVSGGRLKIDGVAIISDSPITQRLTVGHTYLLFLEARAGTLVTAVHGGLSGVYELDGDHVRPLSANVVASDIATRFHNSLRELSQGINSLPRR
jgi:hypothetical protein